MFIKTSFVIKMISDLLALMIIQIRTFECKLWEPLVYTLLHIHVKVKKFLKISDNLTFYLMVLPHGI